MSAVGGLLVVLCAWLAGRALLPGRRALARSAYEEQCTAVLLGLAALPLAAMAVTWLGLPFRGLSAWSLLLAGAAAGAWRVFQERRTSALLAEIGARPWQLALLALLGGASIFLTLAWPLSDFDAILHFAYKGRLLYEIGDPANEAFTRVSGAFGRIMTHPNYPLGVPFLEAFAAHAGGAWSERWVQAPLAFWSACLPGAVALGLRGFSSRAALHGALLCAATPMLYASGFLASGAAGLAEAGLGESKILGGRADLPLAALLAAGCALLLRARQAPSWRAGARTACCSGLCLAGAVIMKNEGLALLGVLVIALVLDASWRRAGAGRTPWLAVAAALLAAAPWLLHRGELPAIDENYGEQVSLERLRFYLANPEPTSASPIEPELYGADWTESSPYRLPRVARYFAAEIIDVCTWGLLWILFLSALAARREPWRRDSETRWLALLVLGGIALYILILLVTPWFLPALHRKGIPERLLLHLLGPAVLFAAAAVESRRGAVESAPAGG